MRGALTNRGHLKNPMIKRSPPLLSPGILFSAALPVLCRASFISASGGRDVASVIITRSDNGDDYDTSDCNKKDCSREGDPLEDGFLEHHMGLGSSCWRWIAWPRFAQKGCFFTDTGRADRFI